MRTAEDASACLSLAYKYTDLRGCVKDQRPALMSDPLLAALDVQIAALEQMFEDRVRALANA
jgi:hypothetical protein